MAEPVAVAEPPTAPVANRDCGLLGALRRAAAREQDPATRDWLLALLADEHDHVHTGTGKGESLSGPPRQHQDKI